MSIDFEREVAAALRSAADQVAPPSLDPELIRRGGKRRKTRALTLQALAATTMIAVVTIVAQTLTRPTAPRPSPIALPTRTAAPTPSGTVGNESQPGLVPPSPAAVVQGIYGAYEQERGHGKVALHELIRSVAGPSFAPILEQSVLSGAGLTSCAPSGKPANWLYQPAGVVGGQAVTIVGPRLPGPGGQSFNIVLSDPATKLITGIACVITGESGVTPADGRNTATSLYLAYSYDRHHGLSLQASLSRLLEGGPTTGDWYLQQAQTADANRSLKVDPITCASHDLPNTQVGSVTIVADGSAALVVVTQAHATPILVTVVLSAKGWTPADIACPGR